MKVPKVKKESTFFVKVTTRTVIGSLCVVAAFMFLVFKTNSIYSFSDNAIRNAKYLSTGSNNVSMESVVNQLQQPNDIQNNLSAASNINDADIQAIISIDDNEKFWELISEQSAVDFSTVKHWNNTSENLLNHMKTDVSENLEIDVWHWKNKSSGPAYSGTDLTKVAAKETIVVNKHVAKVMKAAFDDIFNDPSQPVIYNSGCYVVRRINGTSSTSGHSFGTTVDLNADVRINSRATNAVHYSATYSETEWKALPETQGKHMLFYIGCPTQKIFDKYSFDWGGYGWSSGKRDAMHFSLLGDVPRSTLVKRIKGGTN